MPKITLSTLSSGFQSNAQLNDNFDKITTAFENTLSRDGEAPNTMGADLDMNSNKILNIGPPTSGLDAVTKAYGDANYGGSAVTLAEAAQTAAETAQAAAEAAETSAEAALDSFTDTYLGAKASAPTLDNDGNALIEGALYFNTTTDLLNYYTGSVWIAIEPGKTSVTSNDANPGPLNDKLVGDSTITLSVLGSGGDEDLQVSVANASLALTKFASGTAFAMLGRDDTGAAADIFLGGGFIRDASNLVLNYASQAEAEAGTDNTKVMTALRTKEAIDVLASGWQQYDSATLSAATTADFLMDIETYEYEFILSNITVSTDATSITGLLSTDGGSTFVTSDTYNFNILESDTTFAQIDGDTTSVAITGGAATSVGNATDEYLRARVYVLAGSASLSTQVWSDSHYVTPAGEDARRSNFTEARGAKNANAIRFLPSTGTFDGKIIAFRRKI